MLDPFHLQKGSKLSKLTHSIYSQYHPRCSKKEHLLIWNSVITYNVNICLNSCKTKTALFIATNKNVATKHEKTNIALRGVSRVAATSKVACFVIIVNGFQPLTIITKHSIRTPSTLHLGCCSSPRSASGNYLNLHKDFLHFNFWLTI